MRLLWAVTAVLMTALAGCADEGAPASVADGADPTTAPPTTTAAPPASQTPGPSETGNTTSPEPSNTTSPPTGTTGPGDGNATTENGSGEEAILVEETFTGMLPANAGDPTASGLQGAHTVDVLAGVTRLEVTYTSTHAGLFAAVATVEDPLGTEQANSLDACGANLNPGAAAQDVCLMVIEEVADGAWTLTVSWQLGQATEQYELFVQGFGVQG